MINQPLQATWIKYFTFTIVFFLVSSCATYKEQSNIKSENSTANNEVTYSFYIAGGLGNASAIPNKALLQHLNFYRG